MRLAKAFADIDSGEREPAETTIKGYMPVGDIGGSGTVSVTAFELVVPSRQIVYHAVRFEVNSGGEYPNEGIASIALSDAEKLMNSLEELANAQITTARFQLTEIEATVGDLRVVVFNDGHRRLQAIVEANGATCLLRAQSELLNLRKLVSLAAEHLKVHSM